MKIFLRLLLVGAGLMVVGYVQASPLPEQVAYRAKVLHLTEDDDVKLAMSQWARTLFPDDFNRIKAEEAAGKKTTMPRILKHVPPKYPKAQRKKGLQACVWVGFIIEVNGDAINPVGRTHESLPADDAFVSSAVAAVKLWKFSPAMIDGRPTRYIVVLPVAFLFD